MAQKAFIINSTAAEYNDDELQKLDSLLYKEGVFGDPDTGSLGLVVSERGAPDMNVEVAVGETLIEVVVGGRTFKAILENAAIETVAIAANVSGSNRVDAIIARIDVDTEPDALKTNIASIERIAGTGVSALTDGAIDTAVGSDGWYRLADVTVADSATTIVNANIADTRVKVQTSAAVKVEDASNPSLTEDDTTNSATLESQTGSTSTIGFGEPDTSGNNNDLAQTFIASKTKMRGVKLYKKPDSGTFTGTVTIALQAEVSGAPSGSDLASITISNADYLALGDDLEFEAVFSTEYAGLVIGSTYWIVANASTADAVNHPNLGGATGNPYADGGAYFNNATDGWTAIALTDLYFKTLEGNANQVVKTGDDGFIRGVIPATVTVNEASTTWVKPEGLSYIVVELQANGGNGGSNTGNVGGGSSGGYCKKTIRASDLPPTVVITIGTGTGTTSFGSIMSATGGANNRGVAGTATGGDINIDGQRGQWEDAGSGVEDGGTGGMAILGNAGHGNDGGDTVAGESATGYGAGGGGAFFDGGGSVGNGGIGAPSVVIITEF